LIALDVPKGLKTSCLHKLSQIVFKYFELSPKNLELQFVHSRQMKELNSQFRFKNKTTDVLSFKLDTSDLIGCIVIDLDVAEVQSKRFGHSLSQEILELYLHGLLHLLGFDHETAPDFDLMARYQDFFLSQNLSKIS